MGSKQMDRYYRIRQEVKALLQEAKDVPCARCGRRYPLVCMDFDHLPEYEKSFTIGDSSKWTSVARVKSEIAKTQVVCSNCHRIVTWEREHGQQVGKASRLPRRKDRSLRGRAERVARFLRRGTADCAARRARVRRDADKALEINPLDSLTETVKRATM